MIETIEIAHMDDRVQGGGGGDERAQLVACDVVDRRQRVCRQHDLHPKTETATYYIFVRFSSRVAAGIGAKAAVVVHPAWMRTRAGSDCPGDRRRGDVPPITPT